MRMALLLLLLLFFAAPLSSAAETVAPPPAAETGALTSASEPEPPATDDPIAEVDAAPAATPEPTLEEAPDPDRAATPEPAPVRKPTPVATVAPSPAPTPPPLGRISGKVTVAEKDGQKPGEGAVVYLERVDPESWPARKREPAQDLRITMKEKRFEPRVLPVLPNRNVNFPNLDPVYHNVFSLSGKNKFDLGLYKDGKSKEHAFAEPGVVRVFCNIHPGMTAFILVMQNPWWESIRTDGSYKLGEVPPGRYMLKVWHEKGGESAQEIVVEAGRTARADFTVDASRYKVVPHKNKLGQDYSKDGY